ncbi:hypothetical protein KUCAC02_029277 [Chaenocephalus aceratus]|uniref:Uncharacterized protein n=1 Tax=Chaenocephalus aceratus TaxID=36190 RepID=A0ACB9X5X3_CHAAC|nr:hypothetical protein KUCAC02_029277 [Chaenocephalus aceratus]
MSEVVLQCESGGWYPQPEVLWLDAEGELLSAGPTETLRGPHDLYTVSSRVTVEKRLSNTFTCPCPPAGHQLDQGDTHPCSRSFIHGPKYYWWLLLA